MDTIDNDKLEKYLNMLDNVLSEDLRKKSEIPEAGPGHPISKATDRMALSMSDSLCKLLLAAYIDKCENEALIEVLASKGILSEDDVKKCGSIAGDKFGDAEHFKKFAYETLGITIEE